MLPSGAIVPVCTAGEVNHVCAYTVGLIWEFVVHVRLTHEINLYSPPVSVSR